MPIATAAGISTYYEVHGSGPALLMMGSGSFDSTVERFSSNEWKGIRPFETFAQRYTCIPYDRREAGRSGGRVERITYRRYADQAKGLLDHLGFPQAYVLGVCMGASVAMAMAVAYPETVAGMVLHKPVGGPRWVMAGHERFNIHHLFVKEHGLDAVVALAREKRTFNNAPQAGPWAAVIADNENFAQSFVKQDLKSYIALVGMLGRTLFDRDTAPGAEPEELMRLPIPALITPGHDPNHATSAARYLEECFPQAEYWDVLVDKQNPESIRDRTLGFLAELRHVA